MATFSFAPRAAFAATLLCASSTLAQTYHDVGGSIVPGVVIVDPTDSSGPLFSSSNPGRVSGSFSASLSGFQPTPSYSQLTVGASSAGVALPTGTVVIVYNTGSNPAYVTLGGSGVTATSGNDVVPAGGWMAFTVGANTYLAAIETAGATSLNISGGAGLPTGSGGGGSGGGGGGTVTQGNAGSAAQAWYVQPGTGANFAQETGGNLATIATYAGRGLGPVGAGTAASNSMLGGGVYNSTPPTVGNGQQVALQTDNRGYLIANVQSTLGYVTSAGGSANATSIQAGGVYYSTPPSLSNAQGAALQLNPSGGLKVDGSAVTQPVSGTFWQATQPISAASLPLPTGAALETGGNLATSATKLTSILTALGLPFQAGGSIGNTSFNAPVQIGGANATAGTGASDTHTQRVATSTDSPGGAAANPSYSVQAATSAMWRATANTSGTGATTLTGSSLASNYTYVTDIQCGRTDIGTTGLTVTLNDGAATVFVVANSGGGGGNNPHFTTPLRVGSTGQALTFQSGTAVGNLYCSAQGFFAAN